MLDAGIAGAMEAGLDRTEVKQCGAVITRSITSEIITIATT